MTFPALLPAGFCDAMTNDPKLLDVVALTDDLPAEKLARGQVDTVVEELGDDAVLVEFSDDEGRAYAVTPCRRSALLVLHYAPEAA
jgi:hypothetical protein